jgi:hypothetical protein
VPDLIDDERNSPYPFGASKSPPGSPRNAYELLKIELTNFVELYHDKFGRLPSSEELQLDACRIIFAAEIPSYNDPDCHSWFRDLIMSASDVAQKARLSPLLSKRESRLSFLRINGKRSPFTTCPLEARLLDHVQARQPCSLSDTELQQEAINILTDMSCNSDTPVDFVSVWLIELVRSSTAWLREFRQRAHIPSSTVVRNDGLHGTDSAKIDSIIDNYNELEEKLSEYVELLRGHGVEPDDANLRQKALSLVNEFEDEEWKLAAIRNDSWLALFRRRHFPWSSVYPPMSSAPANGNEGLGDPWPSGNALAPPQNRRAGTTYSPGPVRSAMELGVCLLNDPNVDTWVTHELARWVAATMSPHNPNQHIPTDEELRHQARWMLYDDDDPFNQTSADNPEWLTRFKRGVGILEDVGPRLPGFERMGMS